MAGSEFYDHTTYPANGAAGSSSALRSELDAVEQGFDKLAGLSGNGGKAIFVNAGASAYEAVTATGTGNAVRATSPTLTTPVLGVATATSVNKITWTAPATGATVTIADGKTFTVSNTLTITGTDGSTFSIGTGGSASGTNTGDQLTFKTISVSGQSDIVADSITDTLTIVAGTNITLTTDAATDTLTIASSTFTAATSGEVNTGTNNTKTVTPLALNSALGFSAYFQSAQQSLTGGNLTIAHGLGRTPVLTHSILKCITAELGYSIGDEVVLPPSADINSGATPIGCSVWVDSTNVKVGYTGAIELVRADSGAVANITLASWRLIVRVWA